MRETGTSEPGRNIADSTLSDDTVIQLIQRCNNRLAGRFQHIQFFQYRLRSALLTTRFMHQF